MAGSIVTCPSCGKRNRVAPRPEGVPRCANCHNLLPWVADASAGDFDSEVTASVPVLIDLWAPWCGPCKAVEPILQDLARTRAGELKVVRVNVDEAPAIAERFQVRGIPLLVLMQQGRERDRLAGAIPKPQLEQWLEDRLSADRTATTP